MNTFQTTHVEPNHSIQRTFRVVQRFSRGGWSKCQLTQVRIVFPNAQEEVIEKYICAGLLTCRLVAETQNIVIYCRDNSRHEALPLPETKIDAEISPPPTQQE